MVYDWLMAVEVSDESPHPSSRQRGGESLSTMFDEKLLPSELRFEHR
jgi:hypothetical protein